MLHIQFLALLYLFSLTIGAPTKVLTPQQDKFYSPPAGFESTEPGTILKQRVTPNKIRSFYVPMNIKNSWQLLVRTTDSRGNASAIVTTILEPYNADPSKLVSYHFAEDAANVNCAPSYAIQFGAAVYNNTIVEAEMLLLETALDKGWYVVAPDYEGPTGSFTAGINSGHGALDSIRATLASNNISGILPDAKTIMWGYSGGTIPGGWAAQLQPTYAPELKDNLIGLAVGGFATNITETLVAVDGHLFAGLIPSGINGILLQYPELLPLIPKYLPENLTEQFNLGKELCFIPETVHFFRKQFFKGPNKMVPSGYDMFNENSLQEVLNRETFYVRRS